MPGKRKNRKISHAKHQSAGDKAFDTSLDSVQVGFSDTRKTNKAQSNYVDQVDIGAASGEDDTAYSRRISQMDYAYKAQHRARRRRIVLIVVIALLVVIVAAAIGVAVYFASSNSKLEAGLSNASEALVAPQEGEAYYVLCEGALGSAANGDHVQDEAYLLVRVDEEEKALTFVSVPANLDVRLSDGEHHPLSDAVDVGGQAELVDQVADLCGVDIAHFAYVDAEGLADMVDALGGVEIDVQSEVDDPYAGTIVLRCGTQVLDGEAAVTFLRATNFSDGFETTAQNRAQFMCAFLTRVLDSSAFSFATLVGDAGDYITTDLSSAQIISLGDVFRDFSDVRVFTCAVPGVQTDEGDLIEEDADAWAEMCALMKAGDDPANRTDATANVVPSEVNIEVLNGADVVGAASRAAEMLGDAGYVVPLVGNVEDATIYPETLVIYKDDAFEPAARSVVEAIGGGRVVDGGDYYTLRTDVLVIIGQDWVPLS